MKAYLKLVFVCITLFFISCESNEIQEEALQNTTKSTENYYEAIQHLPNIHKEEVSQYLEEISETFINNLELSDFQAQKYSNLKGNQLINKAATLYFELTNEGENRIIESQIYNSNNNTQSNYQPSFTIINMSSCPIDYTLFIKTELGSCEDSVPEYYIDDGLLHASIGTTTYTDGFASFGAHTWFPNGETTQQIVNQGLNAYFHSVKYLVGTNCANTSIGFCNAAQGTSYTQQCNGCSGGASFYTAAISGEMNEQQNPPYYSNPDSQEEIDQDITLIILEN